MESGRSLRRWVDGSRLPCSSLKHRERLAASISGVGLSRTCLHHCKGLRDFSDDGNVFEEPTYNLKKRNLHYRDYIAISRLPLFYLRKQHVFNSFYNLTFNYFKIPKLFLTDKHPRVEDDTFCSLVAMRTSKNYRTLSQRVRDLRLLLLYWPRRGHHEDLTSHLYFWKWTFPTHLFDDSIFCDLGLMHINMTWQTRRIWFALKKNKSKNK